MHYTIPYLLKIIYHTRLSVILPVKNAKHAVVVIGTVCQIFMFLPHFRYTTGLHFLPPCGFMRAMWLILVLNKSNNCIPARANTSHLEFSLSLWQNDHQHSRWLWHIKSEYTKKLKSKSIWISSINIMFNFQIISLSFVFQRYTMHV